MTLKIVKEQKFGEEPWYSVYLNDRYVKGSLYLEKAEAFYQQLKTDPTAFEEKKEILKSEDLNLPLQANKPN